MNTPINEVMEFAGRVGLEHYQAGYLHDAVRFFMAAKSAVSYEQRFCDIDNPDEVALHLMRAAMAAKYQPDFTGYERWFQQMAESFDAMARTVESGLENVAEAIRESTDADDATMREVIEAGRSLADRCQGIDNSIEALRRIVDTYGDALHKQAMTTGRGH